MAVVVKPLGVGELQERLRASGAVTPARHCRVISLLAQGRSLAEVACLTRFAVRRLKRLPAGHNASGPASPGDRRRCHGARPLLLRPALLERLRERLKRPPDDGGVWTARGRQPSWRPSPAARSPCSAAG